MRSLVLFTMAASVLLSAAPYSLFAQEAKKQQLPQVTLTNPGSAPRQLLRYDFANMKLETMIMEMAMAMSMDIGGMKQPKTQLPTTKTTMVMKPTGVNSDGDLTYQFELTEIELVNTEGVNQFIVDAMKQQLDSSVGLKGIGTVTSRGITSQAEFQLPDNATPQLKESLSNLKLSVQQMSSPLPAEPVGQGAEWEVAANIQNGQMNIQQTTRYTLTQLDDNRVSLAVKVTQSAPKQSIKVPNAPANVQVTLESMDSSGTGDMVLSLSNLVPKSSIAMTTKNVVTSGGQRVTTEMTMDMNIYPDDAASTSK